MGNISEQIQALSYFVPEQFLRSNGFEDMEEQRGLLVSLMLDPEPILATLELMHPYWSTEPGVTLVELRPTSSGGPLAHVHWIGLEELSGGKSYDAYYAPWGIEYRDKRINLAQHIAENPESIMWLVALPERVWAPWYWTRTATQSG